MSEMHEVTTVIRRPSSEFPNKLTNGCTSAIINNNNTSTNNKNVVKKTPPPPPPKSSKPKINIFMQNNFKFIDSDTNDEQDDATGNRRAIKSNDCADTPMTGGIDRVSSSNPTGFSNRWQSQQATTVGAIIDAKGQIVNASSNENDANQRHGDNGIKLKSNSGMPIDCHNGMFWVMFNNHFLSLPFEKMETFRFVFVVAVASVAIPTARLLLCGAFKVSLGCD